MRRLLKRLLATGLVLVAAALPTASAQAAPASVAPPTARNAATAWLQSKPQRLRYYGWLPYASFLSKGGRRASVTVVVQRQQVWTPLDIELVPRAGHWQVVKARFIADVSCWIDGGKPHCSTI